MRPKNTDSEAVATPSTGENRNRLATDNSNRAALQLTGLHAYEGRQVSIALADGSQLSDCVLVSAGRGRVETLWIFTGDADRFIRRADVARIWPAARGSRAHAA